MLFVTHVFYILRKSLIKSNIMNRLSVLTIIISNITAWFLLLLCVFRNLFIYFPVSSSLELSLINDKLPVANTIIKQIVHGY